MMLKNCLTFLILSVFLYYFISLTAAVCPLEELEELIKSRTEAALSYQFRKDNSDYLGGVNFNRIHDYGTVDFIVVGSGSAGSVVANRLSEIDAWDILLLEAGQNEDNFTEIPYMALWSALSDNSWGYYTVPEDEDQCCLGMVNQQCHMPRGKILGGSSSINALMYVRGNPQDYDIWEAMGNKGWSYKDVLPYFKKSEHSEIGDLGYHGTNGPLHVSHLRPMGHPLCLTFLEGLSALGLNATDDYNGVNQKSVGHMESTMKDGRRMSIASAFLYPFSERRNLHVKSKAFVTRVLIDPDCKCAKGVEFVRNKKVYHAFANKEVILSAGAINTPQILMLSGIGKANDLSKLNIPVVADLPVGKYLQDHVLWPNFAARTNYQEIPQSLTEQVQDYLNGGGILSTAVNTKGMAFLNVDSKPNDRPDIQLLFAPTRSNPQLSFLPAAILNYKPEMLEMFLNLNPLTDFEIFTIHLRSESRGSVTLQSADPIDFPNLRLNYYSDRNGRDLKAMYKTIRLLQNLLQTDAFKSVNATLLTPITTPSCADFIPDSREYWYCFLRYSSSSAYHPVGTTRMGQNSSTSVVNSELRVHNVGKLRVIDAGVIPDIVSGNTQAPTVMIGEKGSDLIKKFYNVLPPNEC